MVSAALGMGSGCRYIYFIAGCTVTEWQPQKGIAMFESEDSCTRKIRPI